MELKYLANPLTYTQLMGILSLLIIPLSLLIFRGFNFKFGKYVLYFRGVASNKKGITTNDVLLVLEKTQSFKDAEYRIKHHDKLRDQMHYAEEKTHTMKVMMRENYFDLMATKIDKAEIIFHRDYLNYEILLDLLYLEILFKIRSAIKENGLENIFKKGKGAYEDHIDFKFQGIKNTMTTFLNKRYDSKSIFSRKELFDSNEKKETVCRAILADIFYTALRIAEEKTDEIKLLEEQYREFLCSMGIQEKK